MSNVLMTIGCVAMTSVILAGLSALHPMYMDWLEEKFRPGREREIAKWEELAAEFPENKTLQKRAKEYIAELRKRVGT